MARKYFYFKNEEGKTTKKLFREIQHGKPTTRRASTHKIKVDGVESVRYSKSGTFDPINIIRWNDKWWLMRGYMYWVKEIFSSKVLIDGKQKLTIEQKVERLVKKTFKAYSINYEHYGTPTIENIGKGKLIVLCPHNSNGTTIKFNMIIVNERVCVSDMRLR